MNNWAESWNLIDLTVVAIILKWIVVVVVVGVAVIVVVWEVVIDTLVIFFLYIVRV